MKVWSISRMGSLLPDARSPPSILLLFCRACPRPVLAFDSIHSSINFFGKTHFPVTRVDGIFLDLIKAYTCFSWMPRYFATSLVFSISSDMASSYFYQDNKRIGYHCQRKLLLIITFYYQEISFRGFQFEGISEMEDSAFSGFRQD